MKKIILSIDGMTCSACSNGLEKYLNKQDGIKMASVNLVLANAVIEYDEGKLSVANLEEFVKKAGFKSLGEFKEIKKDEIDKKEKGKFIFFTFLAIFLMYISMGHMINLPGIPFLNMHNHTVNYTITLFIISILFIIYGFDILKNGYKNLVHKTPNMDTLVGIGAITSFIYSMYNMYLIFKGNTHLASNLYFESTCIVIYFIKLGRYIDRKSKNKTKEAIQKLVEITPDTAMVKKDGQIKEVTLDEINKGDILVLKPGGKVAVDGEIIEGEAHFDETFITGESKPISKGVGSKVLAGSLNYDGYIEYRAEKIGKESTISEIVKLVVEATNTKAPIAKIADTVSGYFVPAVMMIAILAFIAYLILGQGFEISITTFVTILVVACPCSLGLATPLAIVVSEGLCATNGILIKKSEILENAQKVKTIIFDKTGTLTYGKLKISNIINYSNLENDEVIKLVGSIEAKSTHPIALAFANYLKENNIEMLEASDYEDISGMGVTARVNGEKIIIGNSKILEKYSILNKHTEDEKELAKMGNSIIYVAKENEILALIGVNDIIREESKGLIQQLRNMKIETIMLTGDNKETAEQIGKELNIEKIIPGVLPQEKSKMVKELKQDEKLVMMCGDGINDSPALANSDIGVSVNNSTDIAMDSSDVILTKNSLNCIINLIKISKGTIKIIKQNLFWAFFYNVLMIPIAMGLFKTYGIFLNPMLASLAMVLSSITVVLNTLRLKSMHIID